MSCCVDRREVVKGLSGLALGGLTLGQRGQRRIKLAFCSQLLCIIPYEVAARRGYFREEGLEVELVYARGGSQALQFLVGRAVDYAATSLDAALQAYHQGAPILRFASTGRLPLFALAASPKAPEIREIKDLEGRTVGVSALGNADHVLLVYLLKKAGVDPKRVRYATLGPNLYEALKAGHVEAGMIQEPALSLLKEAGGRELVNLMDLKQATAYLGGPYEFMGVAIRREERLETFQVRGLARIRKVVAVLLGLAVFLWEVERLGDPFKGFLLQLGGKLGLPSERDGPYLLLRGLVRLLNYEVTQELLKQAKGGRGRSFG